MTQKFVRLWIWERTLKKLEKNLLPNETKAKALDLAVNLLDRKTIIVESRAERNARRSMSH